MSQGTPCPAQSLPTWPVHFLVCGFFFFFGQLMVKFICRCQQANSSQNT